MNDSLATIQASDRSSRRKRDIEYYRLRKWELLTLSDSLALKRLLSRLQERYDILKRLPQLLEAPDKSLAQAVRYYAELKTKADTEIFTQAVALPEVSLSSTEARGKGEVCEASFISAFTPVFPNFREEYSANVANRRVFARIWRQPHGIARGTILAIPGWYMTDPRLCAIALLPGYFFAQGFNVVVYELPYTHRRMCDPRQVFPSSNLVRTNEGIFQAIYELRQLKLWLESLGEEVSTVLGASFGGYLASLWASLDSLPGIIAVSPVCDLLTTVESLFLENSAKETLPALRMAYERVFTQCTRDELAEALSLHSPLVRENRCPADKRLMLYAKEDRVVDVSEIKRLQEHWNDVAVCAVPGGHFGQLCTAEAQSCVAGFLQAL